jgi:hypothetical protein
MHIVIEPIPGGYRAKPWTEGAEGTTPEEALAKFKELIKRYQDAGVRFMELPLADNTRVEDSWKRLAGWLANDPDYDAHQAAIAERRRQLDEDPDAF